ncbi:MAG: Card1-like endonuclease domain-containing protein [Candidatus Cryptobacteroides sp.]
MSKKNRHQIITVGKDFDTVYLGIKQFEPSYIHLLCTKESHRLIGPLLGMIASSVEIKEYLVGPYEVERILALCGKIFEEYPDAEFSANLSEGTKIMAMSVSKVASEKGVFCFYITQDGYYIDTYEYSTKQLTQRISNEEYLRLYGSNVKDYEDVSEIRCLDIHTAYYVKKFLERHREIYTNAKKWYRRQNLPKSEKYFLSGTLEDGCHIEVDSGALSIFRGESVYFDSACRRSCELMFLGRWWEVIVADVISKWKNSQKGSSEGNEIWHDVIFSERDGHTVKNEVDLLVNDSQRLLLIECKSGEVSSQDIFKMDSVCRTYGGNKSKSILVSYMPVEGALRDKCKDLGIYCFAPEDMGQVSKNIGRLPEWLEEVLRIHEL